MTRFKPSKIDFTIGLLLRHHRMKQGISQAALGKAIGISFQQVQKYEKGLSVMSINVLIAMCNALGLKPVKLLSKVL